MLVNVPGENAVLLTLLPTEIYGRAFNLTLLRKSNVKSPPWYKGKWGAGGAGGMDGTSSLGFRYVMAQLLNHASSINAQLLDMTSYYVS